MLALTLSDGYDTWNDIDVWLANLMASNVGITTYSQAIRSSKVNKSMLEVNKLYKNNLQCLYYAYSSLTVGNHQFTFLIG